MDILFVIGVVVFIVKFLGAAFERELPADYHRNIKLESQDADKVRNGEMSRRQFIHNINSGKYR